MTAIRFSAAWVLATLVLGGTARAQAVPSPSWHATLFAGATFDEDLAESGPAVGAALERQIARWISLEAEGASDRGRVRAEPSARTFATAMGSVIGYAGGRVAQVYATFAAGFVRVGAPDPGAARVERAIAYGGGVKVRLSDRLAARGDLRYIHGDNSPNFWRAYGGLTTRVSR